MNHLLWMIGIVLLASSCGGGDRDPPQQVRWSADLRAAREHKGRTQAPRRELPAATTASPVDPIDAATQLMDVGESSFSEYFASPQSNQFWTNFVYRYYPQTGVYLGVSDGDVYVAGGPFGPDIVRVGPLSRYVTPVVQRAVLPVTASGGSLHIADSASTMNLGAVSIPAGALSETATVVLAKAHGSSRPDADLRPLGPIVSLETGGAQFLAPVQISLPLRREGLAAGESIGVFARSPSGGHWYPLTVVDAAQDRDVIKVQTTVATRYVVAAFRSPDNVASAFKPSTHAFRIANTADQTLRNDDMAAGFVGFSSWYDANHSSCASLSRLTDATVQRAIAADSQDHARRATLSDGYATSNQTWSDFLAVLAREMAAGRPALVARVPITAGGPATDLSSSVALVWDIRTTGGSGGAAIYVPSRGPSEAVSLSRAEYESPTHKTYLLPWPELFDEGGLSGVFERYKASLGCVPPTVTLLASPTSANAGLTTQLSWTTSNALSCMASGDWSGAKSASGANETVALGALVGTRNYALTCAGVEGSSASAGVAVTVNEAPACASISGRWTEKGTVDITCDSGDSDSETASDSGVIVQSGCTINYSVMGISRTGRVDGQRLTLNGPAALAVPGLVLTRNIATFEGVISADARRIDATGVGEIAGSFDGGSDRCTLRSRSVLTR